MTEDEYIQKNIFPAIEADYVNVLKKYIENNTKPGQVVCKMATGSEFKKMYNRAILDCNVIHADKMFGIINATFQNNSKSCIKYLLSQQENNLYITTDEELQFLYEVLRCKNLSDIINDDIFVPIMNKFQVEDVLQIALVQESKVCPINVFKTMACIKNSKKYAESDIPKNGKYIEYSSIITAKSRDNYVGSYHNCSIKDYIYLDKQLVTPWEEGVEPYMQDREGNKL